MQKRALITGITGQDGSYLAELLLQKGYKVYGMFRRSSTDPLMRLEHMVKRIHLIYGDLHDKSSIIKTLEKSKPDEIYNLAAQSDVGVSFQIPEETWEINFCGAENLIETAMKMNKEVRIYQASTSEMFGGTRPPQNENSLFNPVSPYAKAKLATHKNCVVGFRERFGLFICSGILFNHESPRRGKNFVTRKITYSMAKIAWGLQDCLELGNVSAVRDWGFAGDYVEAMWLMLQQDKPDDFVVATGKGRTVLQFVQETARDLGLRIDFEGEGPDLVGFAPNGKVLVKVNPDLYRPSETNKLIGDSKKAREVLGWKNKTDFYGLVEMMTRADYDLVKKS